MASVTENDMRLMVRDGRLSGAYYLYGKDCAAVERCAGSVIARTVEKGGETYNLHEFDGKDFDMEGFSEACEALPVFAEKVCCAVRDLNGESLSADALKRVTEIISDLPESTVLVLYYTSVDVTDGKKYPTPKNKKLMDAAAKSGTVCQFPLKTPAALAKEIMAKASKAGCGISREAAALLAERCGCDRLMIGNELDKLTAYAAGGEITEDAIKAMSPRLIETTSFDLARAITRMDGQTALRLLDDLRLEKAEPVSILYAVTGNILDLYRARTAIACRKTAADVVADFGYPKNQSFRVDNAFRDAGRLSLPHLRMCVKTLAETDIAMKSSRADPMILLEEAVVKMLNGINN